MRDGSTTMSASECCVRLVTDPRDLISLRPQWDDLYLRAGTARLSQSFEWMWCAWETLEQPLGSQLLCITIERSARLVLIWPLVVSRHKRLWTVVTPLNSPEDYALDVLVAADDDAGE